MLKRDNFSAQDIINMLMPYYNQSPDILEHIIGELEDVKVSEEHYHALAWDTEDKLFCTFGKPLPSLPVTLESYDELVDQFRAVQEKYSEYGACDTEPRYFFHLAIEQAKKGIVEIPQNSDEWDIFASMEGHEKVSSAMTEITTKIVNLLISKYDNNNA